MAKSTQSELKYAVFGIDAGVRGLAPDLTRLPQNNLTETTEHPTLSWHCNSCGHEWVAVARCGDRLCPTCRLKDMARITERFKEKLAAGELRAATWRFMTLTIRSTPDLEQQLRDLRSAWKNMRRQKWFKEIVAGGLFAVDITETPAGWHAHIHALVAGDYVPQRKLSHEWLKLTGAPIVGIQRVAQPSDGACGVLSALRYLLKYIKKPPQAIHAQTLRASIKGLRLMEGFGDYYKAAQHLAPAKVARKCPECGGDECVCLQYTHEERIIYRSWPID